MYSIVNIIKCEKMDKLTHVMEWQALLVLEPSHCFAAWNVCVKLPFNGGIHRTEGRLASQ